MKHALYLLFVLILFFSTSCSSNAASPTSSIQVQPTIISTATEVPMLTSSTPDANTASGSTPTVTVFTESGGDYRVNLTPADFVDVIDNPYYPLPPGAKWEYEITRSEERRV